MANVLDLDGTGTRLTRHTNLPLWRAEQVVRGRNRDSQRLGLGRVSIVGSDTCWSAISCGSRIVHANERMREDLGREDDNLNAYDFVLPECHAMMQQRMRQIEEVAHGAVAADAGADCGGVANHGGEVGGMNHPASSHVPPLSARLFASRRPTYRRRRLRLFRMSISQFPMRQDLAPTYHQGKLKKHQVALWLSGGADW